MSITRSDARNTVRTRASRSAHGLLCVAVFVVTALNVNRLGSREDERRSVGGPAGPVSATVFRRLPANGPAGLTRPSQADLENEIIGPANLRRFLEQENVANVSAEMVHRLGESLQVSLGRGSSAETLEVSITSLDSEPHRAARTVNRLARRYADDQNAELVSLAEETGREARAAARAAGRELFEARSRFQRFLEDHFKLLQIESCAKWQEVGGRSRWFGLVRDGEHADRTGRSGIWLNRQVSFPAQPLAEKSESWPDMVENPDWLELARRLSELAKQKDQLLQDRTLLHPEVRVIERKILDCRQALDQIPRHVPGPNPPSPSLDTSSGSQPLPDRRSAESPPAVPGPSSQDREAAVRDFYLYKKAVDDADETYQRLSLAEREAWWQQSALPGVELQLARVVEHIQADHRPLGTIPLALIVALAVTAGVGMIVSGLDNDPTLDTPEQVAASLPIPVVGIVPAIDPGAAEATRRRPNRLSGRAMVGCGVGLLFVGVLILLAGYG